MLWGFLILSRILFLARYPHFFDSPEYLRLANLGSLKQMFVAAHDPLHPVYLLLLRLVHTSSQISLISAIFGVLGILAFYLLVKNLFSKKVANRTLLPLALFPHLFLIQTNILHESVEQAFFLGSLLMLVYFLKSARPQYFASMLIFYYLALMNFMGILVWSPLFMILIFWLSPKEKFWINLSLVGFGLILAVGLAWLSYAALLSHERFSVFISDYLLANLSGRFSVWNILRAFRNSLLILFAGFSPITILVICLSGFRFWQKQQWLLIFTMLVIGGIFYLTAGYWYGGLYGRYSAFIGFPLALLFAKILTSKEYLFSVGVLFTFFGVTSYHYLQKPLPQIQSQMIQTLPNWQKQYLVISDYQRPQLEFEKVTTPQTLVVTDSQESNQALVKKVKEVLKSGQSVYFTAQALTFPYYQYDGQALHIISQNPQGQAKLANFISLYRPTPVISRLDNPQLNLYLLK